MNYFTPERHLRLGNLDSEAEFLAAHQEWEEVNAEYLAHLESIKPKLPPELLRLYGEVHLHDAHVLSAYQQDDQFVVTLQPELDARRLVVLTYSVTQEPLVRTVLPPEHCSTCALYTYDELDLDAPEAERPTFRHNILLSNGWELTIRFRSVAVARPLRLIPAPAPAQPQPDLGQT
jgi:hypothetical protein